MVFLDLDIFSKQAAAESRRLVTINFYLFPYFNTFLSKPMNRHTTSVIRVNPSALIRVYLFYPHLLYPQNSHFIHPSAKTIILAQEGQTGALPKLAMETFCVFL